MEHGAIADREIEAATENLTHTYLDLGRSSVGAQVWSEPGFQACAGPLDHAICNFATDVRADANVAERLRQIADRKKCFALYVLPPHGGREQQGALEDKGFTLSHQLKLMVSADCFKESVELEGIEDPDERRKIAEFMVDQFFHRQPTGFRRGIAEATAVARNLKLYKAFWNERTAGAVMISEHGGMIGLYNLCVAPHIRRRGWGSAIVRTIVGQAEARGKRVTLQCEPSLVSWYSSLGFREVGSVSVFGLYRFKEIDIMG
jgi:GNAT superfamily N-acetyltransferase